MDFEKICMMFSMQEPFYGILLSSMQRIPDTTIGTIAVGRPKNSNVFKLIYNPDFIGQFDVDTVLELLKHECLHLALNHFVSLKDKEDAGESRELCNVAVDLEANCYIDRSKMDKNAGGLFVEDFGLQRELGSREYFDLMKKKLQQQKQQAQAQSPSMPCNGGMGGQQNNKNQKQNNAKNQSDGNSSQGANANLGANNGQESQPQQQQPDPSITDDDCKSLPQGFDDHTHWPSCETQQEVQELQEVIDTMIDFAAEETKKRCGHVPGEIAGRIEKIRKKPKPVADWRRYFRRYIGNEFTDEMKKSKKRESKRFPDAAGNRHKRKSHILVAIDTSGSVSMPEYKEFFGQIRTLKEKATFHVVECDTCIHHEYDFNGKENLVLHGGGGTSFEPPINLFIKDRKKYDAIVYFTDGGAWIPDNTPKEMLWVISSRGDHSRERYQVNGAKVVFIKPVES
jgi:predicted metal-dependent peptidase